MDRKKIFLPPHGTFMCGHQFPGDLLIGHEQSLYIVKGKNVDYVASIEYNSCSKCNRRAEKLIEAEVAKLEKEREAKANVKTKG